MIGFLQSTLLSLGLIFFVQLEPAHPFLLWLAAWVSSSVFMMIIYTFVVSFANAGKALGVLLLVIQVSSAGGAYPLQLLPEWFQNISPWLPAISGLRAIVGNSFLKELSGSIRTVEPIRPAAPCPPGTRGVDRGRARRHRQASMHASASGSLYVPRHLACRAHPRRDGRGGSGCFR